MEGCTGLRGMMMKISIRIGGMGCAACAAKIEEALRRIEGVHGAAVNLVEGKVSVEYDPEKVKLKEIEAAVEDAGYRVLNDRITLRIGGMSCAMCARKIESELKGIEGISSATVNLAAERAYISYNPSLTSPGRFREVI